jgi:hypothetical protein
MAGPYGRSSSRTTSSKSNGGAVTLAASCCTTPKPGIADSLNDFALDVALRSDGFALAAATVYPGETDAVGIVERALTRGAIAVKLHCHVQGMPIDDARLHDVYAPTSSTTIDASCACMTRSGSTRR